MQKFHLNEDVRLRKGQAFHRITGCYILHDEIWYTLKNYGNVKQDELTRRRFNINDNVMVDWGDDGIQIKGIIIEVDENDVVQPYKVKTSKGTLILNSQHLHLVDSASVLPKFNIGSYVHVTLRNGIYKIKATKIYNNQTWYDLEGIKFLHHEDELTPASYVVSRHIQPFNRGYSLIN